MRFSLRRLRTTPAKKPRTECRCQPVACMIAAIVAPFGDESRAMTRDCFEPGFNVSAFRLRTAFCPDRPAVAAGFDWAGTWRVPLDSAVLGIDLAAERDARLTARFFADFDIPPEYQSAYEVRGTSIDRLARPGDFLIVLDRKAAGLPLRSGDIVIVTLTKDGLRETTARRFRTRTSAPRCELTFESNDPKHNVGIWLPNQESTESLGGIVDYFASERARFANPEFPAVKNNFPVTVLQFPCSVAYGLACGPFCDGHFLRNSLRR